MRAVPLVFYQPFRAWEEGMTAFPRLGKNLFPFSHLFLHLCLANQETGKFPASEQKEVSVCVCVWVCVCVCGGRKQPPDLCTFSLPPNSYSRQSLRSEDFQRLPPAATQERIWEACKILIRQLHSSFVLMFFCNNPFVLQIKPPWIYYFKTG